MRKFSSTPGGERRAEEPIQRGADHPAAEGGAGRSAGGPVPRAWDQPGHAVPLEVEVQRDGRERRPQAPRARGREPTAEASGGGSAGNPGAEGCAGKKMVKP